MTAATVQSATDEQLQEAFENSWYFIAGAGGPLEAWTTGYEELMEKEGIGKPAYWLQATGAQINELAGLGAERDQFQPDLICLLFPIEGLAVGKLAMFRLRMEDRWFDDVINNMRAVLMPEIIEHPLDSCRYCGHVREMHKPKCEHCENGECKFFVETFYAGAPIDDEEDD